MVDDSPIPWDLTKIDDTRPDPIFPKLARAQSVTIYPFEHVSYALLRLVLTLFWDSK
jgi:hypothetical protein